MRISFFIKKPRNSLSMSIINDKIGLLKTLVIRDF